MISFFVEGDPAAKGSPRIVTRGRGGVPLRAPRVLKDSKRTELWEVVVGWHALRAMRGKMLFERTPLAVSVWFHLPRPKKPEASAPMVKPDLDKLLRSTLDAMTGIVFDDDARIVKVVARKIYVTPGRPLGASIQVASLQEVADGQDG